MGTVNVLNSLRSLSSARVVVCVSTDKVYKNLEHSYPYREIDTLGGYDPYSASKAAGEIVISSYRDAYLSQQGVALASARAGNVVGGRDWSDDRLIPDAIRAWSNCLPLKIRMPNAVRPWQHVLEPLNAYLIHAEQLYDNSNLAGAYNFGPEISGSTSVSNIVKLANIAYGSGSVTWGDESDGPYESGSLLLVVSKARTKLGVTPRWSLGQTVQNAIQWYLDFRSGQKAIELCKSNIAEFLHSQ